MGGVALALGRKRAGTREWSRNMRGEPMSKVEISYYSDVLCIWAYVAERRLEELADQFRDQIEIDSVDFLQFVLDLEKKLEISIPDVDYPKLSSLNGCLSYIENKSQSN